MKRRMRRQSGRTRKRRRVSRRAFNVKRARRGSNRVMSFKRTYYGGQWAPNTTTVDGYWRYPSFQFGTLPNVTEYQALFDQYRVNGIKVTYRPKYDNFAGNDTTDTTLPGVTNQAGVYAHIVNDPRSDLTPAGLYTSATLNIFMEQGNIRSVQGVKPFSVFFKPTINNTISSGTQRVRCPWLQTGNSTIPLYGYHIFMQDPNLTGTFGQSFDQYITFYFQCKGSR